VAYFLTRTAERYRDGFPPARLILEIDATQCLTVGVTHNETVRRDFGSPRRREAAGGRDFFGALSDRKSSARRCYNTRSFERRRQEKGAINAMSFGKSHFRSLLLNRVSQQLSNFAVIKYACITT
jgi:hypothetical protein